MDTGMLFNGLQYKWSVQTVPGETAAADREKDNSYRLELNLTIRQPRAADSMEDLVEVNSHLPALLPELPALLASATVSPDFARLYQLKLDWLKERLESLEKILSRHNYYDCDTILELKHPATGRRALLIQSEMDANIDGSDGDRNIEVDGAGQFFQPQTSYRWRKTSDRPNPFLAKLQKRADDAAAELKKPDLVPAKRQELQISLAETKRQMADLKTWSFLVSKADPSIVLPGFMMRGNGPFAPKFGDYAVVIHGDKMYPAIVGDAGPSYKMGEASLRLCDQINRTGSPLVRPVDDLHVTYLVFPGSADEKSSVPDYDKWHRRCAELLAEFGAPNAPLHEWENIVPPWPTPTPTPDASPQDATPAPDASASPVAVVAPAAAPNPSPVSPGALPVAPPGN